MQSRGLQSLCVFCGSSSGRLPEYEAAALCLGRLLALRQIRLIYGGGNVGLMGAIADEMLAARGTVIGVIPRHLLEKELAHLQVTELKIVGSMHERKALMADLSDAFVALPGGIGTFEELFEILTWCSSACMPNRAACSTWPTITGRCGNAAARGRRRFFAARASAALDLGHRA